MQVKKLLLKNVNNGRPVKKVNEFENKKQAWLCPALRFEREHSPRRSSGNKFFFKNMIIMNISVCMIISAVFLSTLCRQHGV